MRRCRFAFCWASLILVAASASSAEVATAPVERAGGAADYVIDASVQALRQSVLAAQVPGRVVELAVRAGDAVRAGQVIARLDDRELRAAENASRAAALEAQANFDRAELDLRRARELARRQFVSAAALDQAESQARAARARVEALQASSRAAAATLAHAVIEAPYAGLVATTQVEVGDMAMPGTPLAVLYRPGQLRVVAFVPEARIEGVRTGLSLSPPQVEVGGVRVAGAHTTVLPAADPATRTTEVRVDLPQSVRAVPGQFARVRFARGAEAPLPGLSVPAAAVLRRGELSAVYVQTADGAFQQRLVRLGETLPEGRVEVLAGVRAGERVALDPLGAGMAPGVTER